MGIVLLQLTQVQTLTMKTAILHPKVLYSMLILWESIHYPLPLILSSIMQLSKEVLYIVMDVQYQWSLVFLIMEEPMMEVSYTLGILQVVLLLTRSSADTTKSLRVVLVSII